MKKKNVQCLIVYNCEVWLIGNAYNNKLIVNVSYCDVFVIINLIIITIYERDYGIGMIWNGRFKSCRYELLSKKLNELEYKLKLYYSWNINSTPLFVYTIDSIVLTKIEYNHTGHGDHMSKINIVSTKTLMSVPHHYGF